MPLLVFGLLTVASAPFAAGKLSSQSLAFWPVAGPLAFLALAWWYARREDRTGVGTAPGNWFAGSVALTVPLAAAALWTAVLWATSIGDSGWGGTGSPNWNAAANRNEPRGTAADEPASAL